MPVLVQTRTEPLHEADRTELARFGQRPSGNAQFLLDRRQENPQHPRGEYTPPNVQRCRFFTDEARYGYSM